MWSPKLDHVRREYQTLAPLLERLIAYIQQHYCPAIFQGDGIKSYKS